MEDYEHTKKRVQLAKKGVSQQEITELFETFTLEEIENKPKMAMKMFELFNDALGGNPTTLAVVQRLIETMIANENNDCSIFLGLTKNANEKFWTQKFEVLPYTIKKYNVKYEEE